MVTYCLDTRPATPHFPGIGRYVSNLARCLPGLLLPGETLQLITPAACAESEPAWLSAARQHPAVSLLPAAASPFSLRQQWEIPRLLRASGAHRYHSPYCLMPYRPGMPTIVTVYDVIALRFPATVSLRARLLFRLASDWALRAATQTLTISQATQKDFSHYFGRAAAASQAIPLAADERYCPQPPEETARVRQKYALPPAFALYLGINKPHKNLLRLVEAWKEAAPPQAVLAIGGAWDRRYPEARQAAAGIESIHFLGPLPEADLPGLYAAARLFIFPSLYEGFGLPVLEALACGAPVACARASSLPEVAGEAALYFDPWDGGQIALAIQRAWTDERLRAALTTHGLQQARRFSWERTARATLEVYRQVAGSASETGAASETGTASETGSASETRLPRKAPQ